MGRIDVSDILLDPDFIDNVVVISRKSSENSFGENKLSEICVNTVGVIQPIGNKDLQRLPEALRVMNLKSFWVKHEIIATAPGMYTDVLVFKGQRYEIKTVGDWSNWGEGWCEGTCVAQVIAP